MYNGETDYSPQKDLELQVLGDALTIGLLNNLREKDSGVYTVTARGGLSKTPYGSYHFIIVFPCGPDHVHNLINAALKQVHQLIKNGPKPENLKKVKKHQLLAYKHNMKKNRFWLNNLVQSAINQTDKTAFLHYKKKIKSLTGDDIQQIAKKYLTKGHITGILYPANNKGN